MMRCKYCGLIPVDSARHLAAHIAFEHGLLKLCEEYEMLLNLNNDLMGVIE